MSVTSPRNGRRGAEEIRHLVLQAAHRLFSERGYHGTTTRQIADEAGVGESVLFRNFGSKAELFETTIVAPFSDFVNHWATTWNVRMTSQTDPAEIARSFVKGFYGLADEHQELFRTLMAARVKGGEPVLAEVAARVSAKLADNLRTVRLVLTEHGAARHFRELDAPVTVALSVGSVLSLVLLDDWLFPSDQRRPGRSRQIEEAVQMLLYGVTGR
ncbi:TetR family transcriptional regulator [Mycobacterium lentiflavum]|uniref:TetR family transcriptional regulator n=2 Tax=Mycobacterium lentiflavum TaxID=141349 RepID=A0A0E4H028_MYCLN|nr:TetR family transcriptional regulator [Mycobacterium lentiflavum]